MVQDSELLHVEAQDGDLLHAEVQDSELLHWNKLNCEIIYGEADHSELLHWDVLNGELLQVEVVYGGILLDAQIPVHILTDVFLYKTRMLASMRIVMLYSRIVRLVAMVGVVSTGVGSHGGNQAK